MLTDTLRGPYVNKPRLTRRVRSHTWPHPHMVPAKSPLAPRSGTAQDPLMMPPAKGRSQPSPEEPARSLSRQGGGEREPTSAPIPGTPQPVAGKGIGKAARGEKGFKKDPLEESRCSAAGPAAMENLPAANRKEGRRHV